MRLLFICAIGSIHAQRWVKYFADSGHEVHVLAIDKEKEVALEGVKIHIIPITGIRFPVLEYLTRYRGYLKNLKTFISDLKPDVIHVHQMTYQAYVFSKCNFHPFVLTAWGSDILIRPKKSPLFKYMTKKVIKGADIITCDADHMKDELIRLGAEPEKVKLIYFGTDLTRFNPQKKDKSIKKKLGFDYNNPLIISLRALHPIYNVETFIKAIPKVQQKYKNARFIVVGGGSEAEMLRNLAEELGVRESVLFTGRVSDEDLQRYTVSADIYVSTSLSDAGLAASTAEAMACQVPVIITDFGNNGQWVKDGESGLLFTMKDYRQLSDKIIYLLDNKDKAQHIAVSGCEVIKERNNWHKEMERVNIIYRELIN